MGVRIGESTTEPLSRAFRIYNHRTRATRDIDRATREADSDRGVVPPGCVRGRVYDDAHWRHKAGEPGALTYGKSEDADQQKHTGQEHVLLSAPQSRPFRVTNFRA